MVRTHNRLLANHSLGQQVGKRFFELNQLLVIQYSRVKPRIEQMQNGMFDTADVLIHRHPVIDGIGIKNIRVAARTAVSFKIPR